MRHESGFKFLPTHTPPVKDPLLSQTQIGKRIDFGYSVLLYKKRLPNIGFSDESRFCLGSDSRWVWRRPGEYNPNAIVPQVKFAISIMIWGMIGKDYKPPTFIYETTENKENYIYILCENNYLIDALTFYEGNFVYQQDGATPHTAHYTTESINQICDIMLNWPPNSPDLFVIDHIWSLMEKVINFYAPQSKEELIQTVLNEKNIRKKEYQC